jgi:hypothetical protein
MKTTKTKDVKQSKFSKKLEKLNAKIKEQNEAFKKMSPAQKRVAIAHDVLAALKAKKYKAAQRVYCDINFNDSCGLEVEKQGQKMELQTLLVGGAIESCNVCAIGSIFTSKVAIGNDFKVNVEKDEYDGDIMLEQDMNDDGMLIKSLRGIFTETDLRLIEYAFEGEDIAEKFESRSEKFHDKMVEFYESFKSPHDRLVGIMKNIIKNEGTFKI